jgi:superfamily II DNA/RNA helicase
MAVLKKGRTTEEQKTLNHWISTIFTKKTMKNKLRKAEKNFKSSGASSLSSSLLGVASYTPEYWNSMPWKAVDTSQSGLGEFDDCMFMGLEELDGNNFLQQKKESQGKKEKSDKKKGKKTEKDVTVVEEMETETSHKENETVEMVSDEKNAKPKANKKRKQQTEEETPEETPISHQATAEKQQKKKRKTEKPVPTPPAATPAVVAKEESTEEIIRNVSSWDKVELSSVLRNSLIALDFKHPTPIQTASIPMILYPENNEICDVVGIAETGSGKTLVKTNSLSFSLTNCFKFLFSSFSSLSFLLS